MKFNVSRDALLKPLQLVAGVVEKRQTLPVLANVLMQLQGQELSLTGTDLEVEIVGRLGVDGVEMEGEVTVPARKLLDICRSLPDGAELKFERDGERLILRSGRSRFQLSTLPAADFPNQEEASAQTRFDISQREIRRLIEATSFAMAQQDVRYYLNGLLLECRPQQLRAVATDGHRLALCDRDAPGLDVATPIQAIVPRKGVLELGRLLEDSDAQAQVVLGNNHIRVVSGQFTFTSKLVDGKFPDYERVLPRGAGNVVYADRQGLRQAFSRAAILSNEKYRGVRLQVSEGLLQIVANNPEQEEAEEQMMVDYVGEPMEIGFNVSYLLDVTGAIHSDQIRISLADANSSALLQQPEEGDALYVIMPMRL
ncbi:DNA polymerase III subunit beta [Microbulbifer sp. JMSA004]|uniref:DNA polymerase III subunit beta n=1 Tax=unclassified Microbulbifer TaxID=2619833 RepID=UPI000D52C421|nr:MULTISPECIES: DNA polymerase III subunit beta [unclassified Microbulbifer]AWF79341.1 DNA polymerase III subunit beta [Microbulbifer sp. A4B17]WHI44844.1 DNA polymerase III subunit beta [Microbulbifer sp. VAAF005]